MKEDITYEQLESDWLTIKRGTPSMKEKHEISLRYSNIMLSKTNDISKLIINAAKELRNSKQTYSFDDIKWFVRIDLPERYDKVKPIFEGESESFIEFYYVHLFNSIKEKNLEDKIYFASGRNWMYYMSGAQRTLIIRFNNVKRFIEENAENVKNDINKIEAQKKSIITGLVENMVDFYNSYIEHVRNESKKRWEYINITIDSVEIDLQHKLMNEDMYSHNEIKETSDKLKIMKAFIKMNPDKEEYVSKEIENAKNKYYSSIDVLAERLQRHNITGENMKIENVGHDAKFFSMNVIENGTNLYCRSIWVAENSEFVTSHYRFIITNQK